MQVWFSRIKNKTKGVELDKGAHLCTTWPTGRPSGTPKEWVGLGQAVTEHQVTCWHVHCSGRPLGLQDRYPVLVRKGNQQAVPQFSTKEYATIFLSKLFHFIYCSVRTTIVCGNRNITYGHSLTSRKKNNEALSPCLCLQKFWLFWGFFSLTFGYSQLISSIMEQRQFLLLHNYSFKLLPLIYQIFSFFHSVEKHFFHQPTSVRGKFLSINVEK